MTYRHCYRLIGLLAKKEKEICRRMCATIALLLMRMTFISKNIFVQIAGSVHSSINYVNVNYVKQNYVFILILYSFFINFCLHLIISKKVIFQSIYLYFIRNKVS